jgi:hypothetical protein
VAGVLPPSRTDVGTTLIVQDGEMASGVRFSTGAHLASGSTRRDVPLDVGAGYVFERVEAAPGQEAMTLDAGDRTAGPRVDAHGVYVEAAHVIARARGHRSWLGARGEVLSWQTAEGRQVSAGGYARLAWELFGPSEGGGTFTSRCGGGAGFSYGSAGLGLFVESGVEWREEAEAAFVATAGLSVRLPIIGGFAFDLCPRC